MTPTYQISVGGSDRTSAFAQRLLSIRLTETTGKEADTLDLTFDDRGGAIVLPPHGAAITLSIGYVGQPLTAKGAFTVDDTGIEGPPDVVTISARSSDMRQSLKAHKSRAWSATTLGAIVSQVAGENGLAAQVHGSLAPIAVTHRDQTTESDLHFLTRLGEDHDAVASTKGGKLLFVPKGVAISSSGKGLSPLALQRSDLSRWRMKDNDRRKYGTVRARHRDLSAASTAYVSAGAGDPVRTLRHLYPSAALAGEAAHAHHRRGKRKSHTVELELAQGVASAFAGQPITVSGVRDGVNGAWIAEKVEHNIDFESGGYTCSIEATVDGLDLDSAGDGASGYGGDDADSADTAGGAE